MYGLSLIKNGKRTWPTDTSNHHSPVAHLVLLFVQILVTVTKLANHPRRAALFGNSRRSHRDRFVLDDRFESWLVRVRCLNLLFFFFRVEVLVVQVILWVQMRGPTVQQDVRVCVHPVERVCHLL